MVKSILISQSYSWSAHSYSSCIIRSRYFFGYKSKSIFPIKFSVKINNYIVSRKGFNDVGASRWRMR